VTWLAWRRHGLEVRLLAGLAALFAALMAGEYAALSRVAGQQVPGWATTLVVYEMLAVIVVPALLGMFLGAPLVASEVERGTHRLAWAQSVSRRRWLLLHVGLVAGTEAGCGGFATTYQPADRFWTFQVIESGIYGALAALLLGLAHRRVVRGLA
jgi:hypothetical protein